MSPILVLQNAFMVTPGRFPSPPEPAPLRERIVVFGLVVLLHVAVFAAWWMQPELPAVAVNELSVSFASVQSPQAQVAPQRKQQPRPPEPKPAEKPAEQVVAPQPPQPQQAAPASTQATTQAAPVVLDSEPDYRAAYLNNPRPPYPPAAARMGWQGKVILHVEVLADGRAGEVAVEQSCGHEILDKAALQTVKGWRFTPARRFGQAVTEWFFVPIVFKLEDKAP